MIPKITQIDTFTLCNLNIENILKKFADIHINIFHLQRSQVKWVDCLKLGIRNSLKSFQVQELLLYKTSFKLNVWMTITELFENIPGTLYTK